VKRLLVVVDYQNDFVDGSLGFEEAESLERVILDRIESYRRNKHDVIFTLDTHNNNYLETQEGKHLPIAHCVAGTYGHKLYGRVAEVVSDSLVFEKNTFGSDRLFDYLRNNRYDSVELCGLVLGICVLSNAVLAKTALPDAEIIIDTRAAIGNDRAFDLKVVDVLKGIHISIVN